MVKQEKETSVRAESQEHAVAHVPSVLGLSGPLLMDDAPGQARQRYLPLSG